MKRRSTAPRKDVPYLHKKQIEAEADLVLAEWAEDRGEIKTLPIPIDEIVELLLKLTIEFRDMSEILPFGDVLGAIWMREQLIGVSQSLDPSTYPKKIGRYHFTLAHEAGHWRLHREYYLENPYQGALFGDGPKPAAICRSSEAKRPAERQADYFAACLLMPRKMVRAAWESWRGNLDVVGADGLREEQGLCQAVNHGDMTAEQADHDLMENFCRPLAGQFGVSGEAMRIRLEELDLLLREKPRMLF